MSADDLKNWLHGVNQRYVAPAAEYVSSALDEVTAEFIGDLVENFMRPLLARYLLQYGQQGFDRAVREDRDLYLMAEKYRPSLLSKVRKARRFKKMIRWDTPRFAKTMHDFCEEKGVHVDAAADAYIYREIDRWRLHIFP